MKFLLSIIILLSSSLVIAQSSLGFKYQAVARDNEGEPYVNKIVSLRVSIIEESFNGNSVYVEVHEYTTNEYGLINIVIGEGESQSGNFKDIDWSSNEFFLKTELDLENTGSYVYLGSSQLLSVPFAKHAETASDVNDADADPNNEIQELSINGKILSLTEGGEVDLSHLSDDDADSTNEIQTLSIDGTTLRLSDGGNVDLSHLSDDDSDSTNELQALSLSNDTLRLSNGNYVVLTDYIDNRDEQTLSLVGNELRISNGNSIVLTGTIDLDDDPTNELQKLNSDKDSIYLSNGNAVQWLDNDSTNEVQQMTSDKDSIYLNRSLSVPWLDNDSTNELQLLEKSNDTLYLSKGNYVVIPNNMDNDSTNELQSLILSNDSLTLSNSNTVVLNNDVDFFYPDGRSFDIIPVNKLLYDNEYYIVPEGKNLYITHMYGNSWCYVNGMGFFLMQNPKIHGTNGNTQVYTYQASINLRPIIFGEGDSIYIRSNDQLSFNGFLTDRKVETFALSFNQDSSFTVPNNKLMVVTQIFVYNGCRVRVNINEGEQNLYLTNGYYNYFGSLQTQETKQLLNPIFLEPKTEIFNNTYGCSFTLIGYFKELN